MLSFTDVEGTFTVTLQVAFLPLPVVTVIVAVPLAIPFTTPLELTVATFVLLDVHFTVSLEPLGLSIAFSVYVLPLFTEIAVLISLTEVAGVSTFTVHTADLPLVVFAVIVAVPCAFAVTTPLADTVAIFVLLDVHVTLSVVSAGFIVALSE